MSPAERGKRFTSKKQIGDTAGKAVVLITENFVGESAKRLAEP